MAGSGELCRDIAFEAARRGARCNVHELWALLDEVDDLGARLVVDVGSGEPVWWAWWSLGARVVGVTPTGIERSAWPTDLPSAVVDIVGHPADPATVLRVRDQLAGSPVDAVVLAASVDESGARAAWGAYAPMVRPGGVVVMRGIADPATPGVGRFWSGLAAADPEDVRELIGSFDPGGYGVMTIKRAERTADHGKG